MHSEPQSDAPGPSPEPTTSTAAVKPPPPRRRLVLLFVLSILFVSIALNVVQIARSRYMRYFSMGPVAEERYHSLSRQAKDKIAILSVKGAILEQNGYIKQQIDLIRKDDRVKAIVLRVNSPGGTVTASDYLYHHLNQLRDERNIPLVVSMGSLAASGAYYISMAVGDAENTIYAEPTTWSGSIGVIIPHFDLSGLLESWHITDDSIKSRPMKQIGSPTRVMSEQERAILQKLVDESFERFKKIVVAGRPKLANDVAKLEQATTGQVFTTKQALEIGLVDQEGFLEDAIERAAEMAGLKTDDVRVVHYVRPSGLFGPLLSRATEPPRSDMARLLDLTAPRAYYVYTMLPEWDSFGVR